MYPLIEILADAHSEVVKRSYAATAQQSGGLFYFFPVIDAGTVVLKSHPVRREGKGH